VAGKVVYQLGETVSNKIEGMQNKLGLQMYAVEPGAPSIGTVATNSVAAADEAAAGAVSSKPQWLQNIEAGNEFNRIQAPNYPYNEVYVNKPSGDGYFRLDSYNPTAGEIVSRKFTQFSDIQESTAIGYINEISAKYPVGATVADVPSSGTLAGTTLQGQYVLEVPVQVSPVPQGVIDAANNAGVVIRDTNGHIY
jgi:filamentous hemagglutinin